MRPALWRRYAADDRDTSSSWNFSTSEEDDLRSWSDGWSTPLAFTNAQPTSAVKPVPLRPSIGTRRLEEVYNEGAEVEEAKTRPDNVAESGEDHVNRGSAAEVLKPERGLTKRGGRQVASHQESRVARGARSLSARIASVVQSIEEMSERLFYGIDEMEEACQPFKELQSKLKDLANGLDCQEEMNNVSERLASIAEIATRIEENWNETDDLANRIAQRLKSWSPIPSRLSLDPAADFTSRCRVRRVEDGELCGQLECVAEAVIEQGEAAEYAGVLVTSALEQQQLLEPLRPIDRLRWATYSYTFSVTSEDEDSFAPELWPVLLGAVTPFINDARGPRHRESKRHALKQNIDFVQEKNHNNFAVYLRAKRRIEHGETLLSDYGDQYWEQWNLQINTRPMLRLHRRLHDLFKSELTQVTSNFIHIENRIQSWLRLARMELLGEDQQKKNDISHASSTCYYEPMSTTTSEKSNDSHLSLGVQPPKPCPCPSPTFSRQEKSTSVRLSPASSSSPRTSKRKPVSRCTQKASSQRKRRALEENRHARVSMDTFLPDTRASADRVQSWRAQIDKDWRNFMGKKVLIAGVDADVGIAARLAVEADSFDPVLQALNVTITNPSYEAYWTDGASYPLRTIDPIPDSEDFLPDSTTTFNVEFNDGVRTTVQRLVPSLPPAAWKCLDHIPIGTWCRPLRSRSNAPWGLISDYTREQNGTISYFVNQLGTTRQYPAQEIEPIILVRGFYENNDGIREHWQEPAPPSALKIALIPSKN